MIQTIFQSKSVLSELPDILPQKGTNMLEIGQTCEFLGVETTLGNAEFAFLTERNILDADQ